MINPASTLSFPAFYNAIFSPRNMQFPPHLRPLATALDDNRITKLMTIIGPGAGKSNCISIAYPCFALGRDPTMTVLTFSGSENLPRGFLDASMKIIEHSPHFRKFFPACRPDKQAGWSTEKGMFVTGHHPSDPDPSYYAVGLMSKAAVGKHARLIIMDDVHTDENSANPGACEKVIAKYYNTIIGRADPTGAKFLIAGRRWSQWDIYGHLMEEGDWVVMRLPAERPASKALWWDVMVPGDLECCWTEGGAQEVESNSSSHRAFKVFYGVDSEGQGFYWPQMPAKRKEYLVVKRSRPSEAASVYQAQPGGREAGVFVADDFQTVSLGYQPLLPSRLRELGWDLSRHMVVQAWDTAFEVTKDADYSVCLTGILTPCHSWHRGESTTQIGAPDPHYDVFVVGILRKKMEAGELVRTMREQAAIWKPTFVAIERKASGIGLIQSLAHVLPIVGIKIPNVSKVARLTQAIPGTAASVQGWLRQRRVTFWAENPLLPWLQRECLDFSGDGSGYDDGVDTLGLLIGQAISLGRGRVILPSQEAVDDLAASSLPRLPESQHRGMVMLDAFGELAVLAEGSNLDSSLQSTPLCLNCRHWGRPEGLCAIHHRRTAGMDTCDHWGRAGTGIRFLG